MPKIFLVNLDGSCKTEDCTAIEMEGYHDKETLEHFMSCIDGLDGAFFPRDSSVGKYSCVCHDKHAMKTQQSPLALALKDEDAAEIVAEFVEQVRQAERSRILGRLAGLFAD